MSDEIRTGLEDTDSETEVSETETEDTGSQEPEKTFTQEELEKVLAKRLKRQEESISKKYADYDSLKEKAEAYQKIQDEKATDSERWENERNKLMADLKSRDEALSKLERQALISDLAGDAKLPKSLWKRISGNTEEEISEDIASLIEDLGLNKEPEASKEKTPAAKKAALGGGGRTPDPSPSADDIVSKIPRGPQLRVN